MNFRSCQCALALVLVFLAPAALHAAPAVITGQLPMTVPEGGTRFMDLLELIVDDPAGAFPQGYDMVVLDGDHYTHTANTVIPSPGFVGILSVPVKAVAFGTQTNVYNLVVAVNPSALRIQHGGRVAREPAGGYRATFIGNPGEIYALQYSDSLRPGDWHALGAHTTGANALLSIVDVPPPNTPQRFYRMALPYKNDFDGGFGAVTLRGFPEHAVNVFGNGLLKLTDTRYTQETNSVVFDGIAASPAISGFVARFDLAVGLSGPVQRGEGVSFVAGDLGSGPWGEAGPATTANLTIGFDTFANGSPEEAMGIHVWVNGVHLAANPLDPFTFQNLLPVEISYLAGSGLTVEFNGATVFKNLATPGFVFPANGQFGMGGRTSQAAQNALVDAVVISPR